MSRIKCIIIFIVSMVMLLSGCHRNNNPEQLKVIEHEKVIYESDSGVRSSARYFTLSDSSLNFVKLTLPGNKEYALPQVLSAAGVRYSDDRELVWWTKGNTAFAEIRDENGEWKLKYDCKAAEGQHFEKP